jgi:hypothetical protein
MKNTQEPPASALAAAQSTIDSALHQCRRKKADRRKGTLKKMNDVIKAAQCSNSIGLRNGSLISCLFDMDLDLE